MRATAIAIVLGAASLLGCTSQDTNINFNPTIACETEGQQKVEIPTGRTLSGGNVMYFEILLDAEVQSDKQSSANPDISPTLTLPLP